MPLDLTQNHHGATSLLWFIHARAEHCADLGAILGRLKAKSASEGSAFMAMALPSGDEPLKLGPEDDAIVIEHASHGSQIEFDRLHLLPPGRLFVVEDGKLQLRPRDAAQPITPFAHLAPSLGAQYGNGLTVLLLDPEPDLDCMGIAAIRAFGGRVLTREDLDETLAPEEPGPADAATAHMFLDVAAERTRPIDNHDLRQPLQTLTLLQSLLQRQVSEPKAKMLVERLGDAIAQLSAMVSDSTGPLSRPGRPAEDAAPAPAETGPAPSIGTSPLVYLIDDDASVRDAMRAILEEEGCDVHDFGSCEDFLEAYAGEANGCLLVDAYLPGMSGLALLEHLKEQGSMLPAIMITGSSDVQMAVRAMKTGACDFIEKPVGAAALLSGVRQALAQARDSETEIVNRENALQCLKGLTRRQRQIMTMVLDGHPSKNIAADLGISQRTVENHRAAIMKKTGSRSLPALARLALALPPEEHGAAAAGN